MAKQPLTIEHALLGFLRRRPMHAYDLHQKLMRADALGSVWRLKQSLAYVMLERLARAGYITSSVEQQGSRPPRKLLHLTPAGRQAFARWQVAPVEHGRDFRLEFLVKLYFAAQDGRATAGELIAAQQAACLSWLADIRARADQLGQAGGYNWLVLRFRMGQIEAIQTWLDTCAATLAPSAVRGH